MALKEKARTAEEISLCTDCFRSEEKRGGKKREKNRAEDKLSRAIYTSLRGH
jgi:hypothetical protein